MGENNNCNDPFQKSSIDQLRKSQSRYGKIINEDDIKKICIPQKNPSMPIKMTQTIHSCSYILSPINETLLKDFQSGLKKAHRKSHGPFGYKILNECTTYEENGDVYV
jgi:hypothetical protein